MLDYVPRMAFSFGIPYLAIPLPLQLMILLYGIGTSNVASKRHKMCTVYTSVPHKITSIRRSSYSDRMDNLTLAAFCWLSFSPR